MTLHQLHIALEIARTGSTSRAAELMRLTQPNISRHLATIENELGYEIFVRTTAGMVTTDKGKQFLEHAQKIIEEADHIHALKFQEEPYRLNIGIASYTPPVEAFLKVCQKFGSQPDAELKYQDIRTEECIQALIEKRIDMAVVLVPIAEFDLYSAQAHRIGFTMDPVCDISLNLNLGYKHPLVLSGAVFEEDFNLDLLSKYPNIDFSYDLPILEKVSPYLDVNLKYKYKIRVADKDSKYRLLTTTDGWSIGAQLSKATLERYNLVSRPLQKDFAHLCTVVRIGDENRREFRQYTGQLRAELSPQ